MKLNRLSGSGRFRAFIFYQRSASGNSFSAHSFPAKCLTGAIPFDLIHWENSDLVCVRTLSAAQLCLEGFGSWGNFLAVISRDLLARLKGHLTLKVKSVG